MPPDHKPTRARGTDRWRRGGLSLPAEARRSLRERPAHLLGRVIFYALLLLIVAVAIPYGTVEPWWEALFECLVFALGVLWISDGMLRGEWIRKEHRIFLPLLLLALYAFIQTLPHLAGSESVANLKVWNA